MMWKYKKVMQKKVEYVLKAAITGVALTYAFSGFLWNKRKELVQEWKKCTYTGRQDERKT